MSERDEDGRFVLSDDERYGTIYCRSCGQWVDASVFRDDRCQYCIDEEELDQGVQ